MASGVTNMPLALTPLSITRSSKRGNEQDLVRENKIPARQATQSVRETRGEYFQKPFKCTDRTKVGCKGVSARGG